MTARPSTQEVVFGGLMAALTIALAAPLGPLLPSVLALPVALAFARHGRRSAIWSAVVATGGCLMFYDLVTVLGFIIPSGILAGLALGWGAWNERPPLQTVLLATAANVAGYFSTWLLTLFVMHQNPIALYQESVDHTMEALRALMPGQQAALAVFEPYLRQGFVAGAVGYSFFMALAAYVVALIVFRQLGSPLVPPAPLARQQLPLWSAVLFLAGLAASRFSLPLPGWALLHAAGYNLTLVGVVLFWAQGMLVAALFARAAGLGGFGMLLGAVLVTLFYPTGVIIGVADSLVNLRRFAVPRAVR